MNHRANRVIIFSGPTSKNANSPQKNMIRPISTSFGLPESAYISSPIKQMSRASRIIMGEPSKPKDTEKPQEETVQKETPVPESYRSPDDYPKTLAELLERLSRKDKK